MLATFTALMAAHVVADFLLQPKWMIQKKKNPIFLLLHIAVITAIAAGAVGGTPVILLAIVAGSHLIADAIKVYFTKDTFRAFLLDQIFHILVIIGVSVLYPNTFADWWWAHLMTAQEQRWLFGSLTLVTGTVINLHVGGIVIKKATQRFSAQIPAPIAGLRDGGAYIGWMERAIVMLFILINQPTGIGFLITAKSILRFGDIKDDTQRQSTEYIIIGTFMSFGWGLMSSVGTQYLLNFWKIT